MDTEQTSRTRILLEQHHAGDPAAIGKLIEAHYDAIKAIVHRQMNPGLRKYGDTGDFLHQVMIRILKSGPRFVVSDEDHFRNLMVCLVRNVLRDGGRRVNAMKRDPAKQHRLPTHVSVIDLDIHRAADKHPTQPDAKAQQNEEIELAGMALELLPPDEREIIHMRQDGAAFAEIGSRHEISTEGARKKHGRAVRRLQKILTALNDRDVQTALQAAEGDH